MAELIWVAGDVGGRILTGVDDHQGGSSYCGVIRNLGDAESDTGQNYGGENDGQQVLPDGVQDLQEVNRFVTFVFHVWILLLNVLTAFHAASGGDGQGQKDHGDCAVDEANRPKRPKRFCT